MSITLFGAENEAGISSREATRRFLGGLAPEGPASGSLSFLPNAAFWFEAFHSSLSFSEIGPPCRSSNSLRLRSLLDACSSADACVAELELSWFTCKRSELSPILVALKGEAEREVSPSLINSAARCRAVACLLTELEEEEEEENPAGGFGLPADFPASTSTILLFLCVRLLCRPHSSCPFIHFSISLSVVSLCLGQGWRWMGRREVEPKSAGAAVAASANSLSLLPEAFIRVPTYWDGERGLEMGVTSSLPSEWVPPSSLPSRESELSLSFPSESFTSAVEDKEAKAEREDSIALLLVFAPKRETEIAKASSEWLPSTSVEVASPSSAGNSLSKGTESVLSFLFLFFSFSFLSLLDLESFGILLS